MCRWLQSPEIQVTGIVGVCMHCMHSNHESSYTSSYDYGLVDQIATDLFYVAREHKDNLLVNCNTFSSHSPCTLMAGDKCM